MSKLYQISKENKASLIENKDESEFIEKELEDLLECNPSLILNKKILIIGRQITTDTQKRIDLLALDENGYLIVIELKRGYAPREMIAQVLDYSSWLNDLSERKIEEIARSYFEKNNLGYSSLADAFEKSFNKKPSLQFGGNIINVLFAQDFPTELLSATKYLYEKGVDIICIKFDLFKSKETLYLNTNIVIGEEVINETKSNKILNNKSAYKNIMKNVSDLLNIKYETLFSNFDYEIDHTVKVYQNKTGHWTCSYIDWIVEGVNFVYEVAIYEDEDTHETGFCAYVHTRKKSEYINSKFENNNTKIMIEKLKLLDETETDYKPVFTKYVEGVDILDEDKINDLSVDSTNQFLQLL